MHTPVVCQTQSTCRSPNDNKNVRVQAEATVRIHAHTCDLSEYMLKGPCIISRSKVGLLHVS